MENRHLVFEILNFELKEIVIGITTSSLDDLRKTHPRLVPSLWSADHRVSYRCIADRLSPGAAAHGLLQRRTVAEQAGFGVFVAGLISAGVC